MEALTRLCRERFEAFGTAGNAHAIRPLPMAEMARRYRGGALDRIAAARPPTRAPGGP